MGLVSPAKLPILRDVPLLDLRYEKVRKLLDNPSSTELLKSMSCIIDNQGIQDLFSKSTTPLTSFFDENALSAQGILSQLLAKDYKTYMVDDILTKVDRATMSVSLEGREPFLDQNIIEWAAQLPDNLKINNGNKKYILKQIVHRHLPKTMMERPKMGFGVPIKTWFSNELSDYFSRYLNRALLDKQGILNATTVEFWLQSYNSGKTQYITHLWYALMFQMWYEKWMD
jgi:asparagine synthase (glutamine-hydrolysing)